MGYNYFKDIESFVKFRLTSDDFMSENDLREIIGGKFKVNKPYFLQYTGAVERLSENNYYKLLQDIKSLSEQNKNNILLIDTEFSKETDLKLIYNVVNELSNVTDNDIHNGNYSKIDVTMFENKQLNSEWLKSILMITSMKLKYNEFTNKSTRDNFIADLIVRTYKIIYNFMQTESEFRRKKIIVFNGVSERDLWFLLLCYQINIDIILINPMRNIIFTKSQDELLQEINFITIEESQKYRYVKLSEINSSIYQTHQQQPLTNNQNHRLSLESDLLNKSKAEIQNTKHFLTDESYSMYPKVCTVKVPYELLLDKIKTPEQMREQYEVDYKMKEIHIDNHVFELLGVPVNTNKEELDYYKKIMKYINENSSIYTSEQFRLDDCT